MKALSIMQPWAWLIVNGWKGIENRSWRCHFRGLVLIHAGKKMDEDAYREIDRGFHPVTGEEAEFSGYSECRQQLGGIVGEAVITGCVERADDPWFVGPFGILMRDARSLPFRPCKGALGFFTPDLASADSLAIGDAS